MSKKELSAGMKEELTIKEVKAQLLEAGKKTGELTLDEVTEKLSPYQQNLACFRALASPAFGADEKEKIPVLSLIKSLHKSLHSLMRYFKKCVDLSVASGNPIGASPARRSGSRTALMPTSVEQPSGADQLKKWCSHN